MNNRVSTALNNALLDLKLGKWTLVSALPFYYDMHKYWFIKPNTTKAILKHFGVQNLAYQPSPTHAFYQSYSDFLLELRELADPKLSISNAAFTGFLMMSIG